jgi:hypothetical protein
MDKTIDLYQAIERMRTLTRQKKFFSFSHATYNRETGECNGIREVNKALLRKPAANEDVANSDYKLFYVDEAIGENRVCWQPLLMTFNELRVKLS